MDEYVSCFRINYTSSIISDILRIDFDREAQVVGGRNFLGFGGGAASTPPRGRIPHPRLCESIPLSIGEHQEVRWRTLLSALRERADQRRGFRSGKTIRRDLPFRDVILKGPFDPDAMHALELRDELSSEFADTRLDFHTLSIRASTKDSKLLAFFGNGVFAPDDEDVHVADLELSWHDPLHQDFDANNIIVPVLDPSSGGGLHRPAAWYAGQMGVAIGFHGDMAPAFLDGPSAPAEAIPTAARDFFIYIGRLDRFTPPVIEMHSAEARTIARATCDNHHDWWLRDGEWQGIRADIGGQSLRLWFRLTSRTGDIVFRNGAEFDAAPRGKARIVVRGILVPELPTLGGLGKWLLAGSPTRWSVDFDGQGRLRSQEILDLAHSVVAQWGTRFGIYRHREARWVDRGSAITGLQDFSLSHGARVAHRNFPTSSAAGHKDGSGWKAIYRRLWSLVQFADERPLGYFDLPPRARELIGAPQVGTPVIGARGHPADLEWKIGLDWLNRAAQVTIADQTLGLAEYWCKHWTTRCTATEDGLMVEVSAVGTRIVQKYQIAPGARGPLGPLYIEYKIR
jgi:hypothetical protein